MTNEEYLQSSGISPDRETIYQEMLSSLNSYGDNKWWLSKNPRVRAYYQTLDTSNQFFMSFSSYITDLGILLGREVPFVELRLSNRPKLSQEVTYAWAKLAQQ